jgi:lipopolysaccharide export LptBFGC system permease protein LptF
MSQVSRRAAAPTVVMFVVIAAVAIALATATDLHIVLRGVISIGAGLVAALVTHLIANRARPGA